MFLEAEGQGLLVALGDSKRLIFVGASDGAYALVSGRIGGGLWLALARGR